eukprot:NODE_8107_length_1522_cov_11.559140.p1 GENE.NODE_8107_length_1522_cov_11.559140~~NODE_8107_length_1522_cov_11.559140.p1  ORF type:complete len:487 (+),score=82.04 NODE_8107_length_1522_cov_11.559140:99-1463(+)
MLFASGALLTLQGVRPQLPVLLGSTRAWEPRSALTLRGQRPIQRIRREIRQLPKAEFDALVSAMWTMKRLDEDEGRRRYGPRFRSYDSLVAQHMNASLSATCDNAHYSPVFAVYHRLYTLAFEESLRAVDPSIMALPYWDYRLDTHNPAGRGSVFSDEMFGDFRGDPNASYMVKNGRFADWPISDKPDKYHMRPSLYGFLRGPMSMNEAPNLTRHGGGLCDVHQSVGNVSMWGKCLAKDNIRDWHYCLDLEVHGRAHFGVGGGWERYRNMPQDDSCFSFYGMIGNQIEGPGMGSYIYPLVRGCLACPKCIRNVTPPSECTCSCTRSNCTCDGIWTGRPDLAQNIIEPKYVQVIGDHYDPISSPNDPIFFFHHANLDRYLTTWMARHSQLAPQYYGYPNGKEGEGYCEPHLLDGVIHPEWPFEHVWEGQQGPATARGVFDHLSTESAPYRYDSLI